jgi:FKBP-type peptidyl-prolyl cis-trans isomerase
MQPGGKRRLVIPPSLGYGSTKTGDIPANSILVFEIEVVEVR